jgi:hypothetical protein
VTSKRWRTVYAMGLVMIAIWLAFATRPSKAAPLGNDGYGTRTKASPIPSRWPSLDRRS